MAKTKIYYSKMNKTPSSVITRELAIITTYFGMDSVIFHNSGVYDESKIRQANVLIVTGFNGGYVGKGVYSEICNAMDHGIPCYQFATDKGSERFYKIDAIEVYDKTDMYLKYGQIYPELQDEDSDDNKIYDLWNIGVGIGKSSNELVDGETNLLY